MSARPKGPKLSKADLRGYEALTHWIVVVVGEGHQHYDSYEDAIASAKEQAEDIPGLVIGVYQLAHYASARVLTPQLFDPGDRK